MDAITKELQALDHSFFGASLASGAATDPRRSPAAAFKSKAAKHRWEQIHDIVFARRYGAVPITARSRRRTQAVLQKIARELQVHTHQPAEEEYLAMSMAFCSAKGAWSMASEQDVRVLEAAVEVCSSPAAPTAVQYCWLALLSAGCGTGRCFGGGGW